MKEKRESLCVCVVPNVPRNVVIPAFFDLVEVQINYVYLKM